MKKTRASNAPIAAAGEVDALPSNGQLSGAVDSSMAELSIILGGLQRIQEGDFSVRMPGSWTGLPGKIADTFNGIVAANEQMALELARVGQAGHRIKPAAPNDSNFCLLQTELRRTLPRRKNG